MNKKIKLVNPKKIPQKGIVMLPTKDVINRLGNLFNLIAQFKYKFSAKDLADLINMVDIARFELCQTFVLTVGATIEKVITPQEIKEDEEKAFKKAFDFMRDKYGNILEYEPEYKPEDKPIELNKETG